jgi:hypothetical protein
MRSVTELHAGTQVTLTGSLSGADPRATLELELEVRVGGHWVGLTRTRIRDGQFTVSWSVPLPGTKPVLGSSVAIRALAISRRLRVSSKPATVKVVAPMPTYIDSFDLNKYLGRSRLVLVRYLRLGSDSRADVAFAEGTAHNLGNGIDAMALICGSQTTGMSALAKAGVDGPVLVDTAADCSSSIDAALDGVIGPRGGPERLFLPSGRPVASELNAADTILAFNIDPARAASAVVKPWMRIPHLTNVMGNIQGNDDLDVPELPNIVKAASPIPASDEVIQGFWEDCPTCVASEADYHLQEWADAHPSRRVVAFTCASSFTQASDWAYEHGWKFPVIAYDGPLSFGDCFDRVEKSGLGITYYAETIFYEGARASDQDTSCEFPNYPNDWGWSCASKTDPWTPSPADQIAAYQNRIYSDWQAAGGK